MRGKKWLAAVPPVKPNWVPLHGPSAGRRQPWPQAHRNGRGSHPSTATVQTYGIGLAKKEPPLMNREDGQKKYTKK